MRAKDSLSMLSDLPNARMLTASHPGDGIYGGVTHVSCCGASLSPLGVKLHYTVALKVLALFWWPFKNHSWQLKMPYLNWLSANKDALRQVTGELVSPMEQHGCHAGGLLLPLRAQRYYTVVLKVAAPSIKPEIRLRAQQPSSERMSQSDERKITSVPDHAFVPASWACSLISSFKDVAAQRLFYIKKKYFLTIL